MAGDSVASTSSIGSGSTAARPGRRLPDFLIIGAAKTGTTSVCNYLRRHPALFFPEDSEPQFFSHDENYTKGVDWYASLFDSAAGGQICGEKSTAYTRWPTCPDVPKRIAEVVPDVKLIYMLRHPIDRAYSHYVHRVTVELYKGQPIPVSFEQHVKTDTMCVESSEYMKQIEQYLPRFAKDRLLVLFFEDFVAQPKAMLQDVMKFIGVDPAFDVMAEGPIHKKKAARQREQRVRKKLTGPVKAIPGASHVGRLIPRRWKDAAYRLLRATPSGRRTAQQFTPTPMRPETTAVLLDRFREGNDRLAEFVGRDLSHWNQPPGSAQKVDVVRT